MKYAFIDSTNKVVEIRDVANSKKATVQTSLGVILIAATNGVEVGDIYSAVSKKFTKPSNIASLGDYIISGLEIVDNFSNTIRMSYLTNNSTQLEIYKMKYDMAVLYRTNLYPTITPQNNLSYTMLVAESNALSLTVTEVADLIISTHDLWIEKLGLIEGERLKGKANIKLCITNSDVDVVIRDTINILNSYKLI